MPKKITITVKESEQELRSLLRKSSSDRQRERLKALLLLKQGKFIYQSHLASKLGYTEKTIREWLKHYQSEGLSSFITIRVGGNRLSSIPKAILQWIEEQLNNPQTTITSYTELQRLIQENFNEVIPYSTLNGYCKRVFNSKLKVSRKSHYKKNKQAETVAKEVSNQVIL